MRLFSPKSLKQRRMETGRSLALDGKAWKKLREVVLSRDPLCRCGCGRPSTDAHHVDNDPTNNDLDNLMGLACECHSFVTRTGKLPTGYDKNGFPTTGPWAAMVADLQKSPATEADQPSGFPSFNADCLKNRQHETDT